MVRVLREPNMTDSPKEPPALSGKPMAAPAIAFREKDSPSGEQGAARPRERSLVVGTADLIAIGVVVLAFGAVLVAVIVSLGFVFGKIPGKEAAQIILGCVGGSSISGIAALVWAARRTKT